MILAAEPVKSCLLALGPLAATSGLGPQGSILLIQLALLARIVPFMTVLTVTKVMTVRQSGQA